MPDLQQTADDAPTEVVGPETYRQALRVLGAAYQRIVGDMASAVASAEGSLVGTGEFVLTEIENRYVHRIRDLQTLIGTLRSQLHPGRPAVPQVDELRVPQDELATRLAQWFHDHPGAELVQLVVERTPDGELQVVPVYFPSA